MPSLIKNSKSIGVENFTAEHESRADGIINLNVLTFINILWAAHRKQ